MNRKERIKLSLQNSLEATICPFENPAIKRLLKNFDGKAVIRLRPTTLFAVKVKVENEWAYMLHLTTTCKPKD